MRMTRSWKSAQKAEEKGLWAPGRARLTDLVLEYSSIFRISLGKNPVKLEAFKIDLNKSAKPVAIKALWYPKEQRDLFQY